MCRQTTQLQLLRVNINGVDELKEVGPSYTSMPALIPEDGNEEYVCCGCGAVIGCDIEESAAFSTPAGIYQESNKHTHEN